jgi:hypothetical protein
MQATKKYRWHGGQQAASSPWLWTAEIFAALHSQRLGTGRTCDPIKGLGTVRLCEPLI